MAGRQVAARLRDLPEPWWSASPFQTGPIAVPAPRPREPKRRRQPPARPVKTKEPARTVRKQKRERPAPLKAVVAQPSRSLPTRARVARPQVRIHRRSAHGLRFPLFVGVLALACLVLAPLALNVAAYQAEWRSTQLEQTKQQLLEEQGRLVAQQAGLKSSDRVRKFAENLGMGPAPQRFLNIGGPGPVADAGVRSEESLP